MREKGAHPDAQVAALAACQHGVVSINQLRKAGLIDAAVLRRVRAGACTASTGASTPSVIAG
jgi:hypothetical protein